VLIAISSLLSQFKVCLTGLLLLFQQFRSGGVVKMGLLLSRIYLPVVSGCIISNVILVAGSYSFISGVVSAVVGVSMVWIIPVEIRTISL